MATEPREIDYRTAFYELIAWVKLEVEQKPQQLMQAQNTTLQELHMAQGMTHAYHGVLAQAEFLLESQANPEREDTDG